MHSRLLVVCHCVRDNDSIRIISARKADKQERRDCAQAHRDQKLQWQ
ncbi:MAG: BrnT family toxin [Candidatus Thiodiazotropha sp.]